MALVSDIDSYESLPPVLNILRRLLFLEFTPSKYRAGCPCRIKPEFGHFLWQIRRDFYSKAFGFLVGIVITGAGIAQTIKALNTPFAPNSAANVAIGVAIVGVVICIKVLRDAVQEILYLHFQSVRGDVAPVIVVQEKPLLLALIFDVSMGDRPSRHVLKVFQPQKGSVGDVPLGYHFGATCYYGFNDEGTEWADVLATPLTVYTTNRQDIQESISRVDAHDWGRLEAAVATLPATIEEGVFRLENGNVGAPNETPL